MISILKDKTWPMKVFYNLCRMKAATKEVSNLAKGRSTLKTYKSDCLLRLRSRLMGELFYLKAISIIYLIDIHYFMKVKITKLKLKGEFIERIIAHLVECEELKNNL